MKKMDRLIRVRSAQPVAEFKVQVEFTDGTTRIVDVERYLRGPMFEAMREDPALFRAFHIEGGTLAWPNGADIDPDVLYHNLKPAWMDEEPQLALPATKQQD